MALKSTKAALAQAMATAEAAEPIAPKTPKRVTDFAQAASYEGLVALGVDTINNLSVQVPLQFVKDGADAALAAAATANTAATAAANQTEITAKATAEAVEAATTATNAANEAAGSVDEAKQAALDAAASVDAAKEAAAQATANATTASQEAADAAKAAAEATTKADTAAEAADAAAKAAVEQTQEAAETVVAIKNNPPKIVDNEWHTYDMLAKEYTNTGVSCKGDPAVRGTDYWTTEDQTAVKTQCEAYIDQSLAATNAAVVDLISKI